MMTGLVTATPNGTATPTDASLRMEAVRRLKKKRDFKAHLLAYALVNGSVVVIWAVVWLAGSGWWFPWPIFPILGWGIGLVFHAREVYGRPFSDEAVGREIERLRSPAR